MNAIVERKPTVATAEIQGVTYPLIPQTLAVRKRIEELSKLEERYESGEIDAESALKMELDFIKDTADCRIFEHLSIDMLDISDVECAVIAILNGYRNKVTKEKLKGLNLLPTKAKQKKKNKKK